MNIPETNRWPNLLGGLLLILAGSLSFNVLAQDEDEGAQEEAKKLEKVVITGSRIARTQIEGPAPVVIISREQIDREGFQTVEGVLKSLSQANGIVQNEFWSNQFGGFTANANSINLRNLGPGRLLLLIDGRRATDYPLAYNSQSNIVNLSTIPLAAVERIEVLSGGASAIYGSDAVAGVVNIILRKDVGNSVDVIATAGGTSDGGMSTTNVEAVGGFLGDRWNITYALDYMNRKPLYAGQRDYMDSVLKNPAGPSDLDRMAIEFDATGNAFGTGPTYIDPGDCDGFSASSSIVYTSRPDPWGGDRYYCGSASYVSEFAIVNQREQVSFYTYGSVELGDAHELYGQFNIVNLDAELDTAFTYWHNLSGDYFYMPNSSATSLAPFGVPGMIGGVQRIFSKEEMGAPEARTDKFYEDVANVSLGIKGEFFSPLWSYDVVYSRSQYDLERDRIFIVQENALNYFFSNIDYVNVDPLFDFYPTADINYTNLFSMIDQSIWESLTEHAIDTADSSNDVITAVITGDIMELPAGPLGMAAVLEWASQDYQINLDPRLSPETPEYFWGVTGTGGGGERDRAAIGVEFSIPLVSQLQLMAAVRYDEYNDITNVSGALTHNVGLEYRPNDKLLIRGSNSSSFRAPDMHFVFAEPSGFFGFVDDYYLCERDEPGVPLADCSNADLSVFGERQGDPRLQEEEGDSYTFGFVFEPTGNVSMSIDYWNIQLENIVIDRPRSDILQLEADCRFGREDINSGKCQDALSKITRGSPLDPDELVQVDTVPINAAVNDVNGIDATFQWNIETERRGEFLIDIGYSHVLEEKFKTLPTDELESVRDSRLNNAWRSRVRASVSWNWNDFSATLFGDRFGSFLSLDEQLGLAEGRSLPPRWLVNLTAGYELMDGRATIGILVNNLFNKKPPKDVTYTDWPYFDVFNYGQFAIGRMVSGRVSYRFDY